MLGTGPVSMTNICMALGKRYKHREGRHFLIYKHSYIFVVVHKSHSLIRLIWISELRNCVKIEVAVLGSRP